MDPLNQEVLAPHWTAWTKLIIGLGLLSCLLATGCTAKHYRESADKQTYGIIAAKSRLVPDMESHFTIQTNLLVPLTNLAVVTNIDEALGKEGAEELGARIIPLATALEIAVKNSRTYQNRKEMLYLEALSLTLARHRFAPIFTGSAQADYQRTVEGIDELTTEHSISGSGETGVSILTRSGARIAAAIAADFRRFLVGDPRMATGSALSATLTQPLLRGAGYRVTMESLTQAERNVLYALRDFVQFRRDFVVQITSGYYGVLRNRDSVNNEWARYLSFRKSTELTRAFVREGRTKQSELGRLEQEQISADIGMNNAIRNYRQSIDQFKILLGLPTDAHVVLDSRELANLKLVYPNLSLEDAVRVALATRLDLYTARDQFEDAHRKIYVDANSLKPDLDLILQANVASKPGSGLPELDFNRTSWSGGVDLNLPFDRLAERNEYRASFITYERAQRALELAVDNIKLDVYDDWRNLEQAKRNYESSELGIKLSQSRVAEQTLLAELGRATAKDQVDAQNDLTTSMNARTSAIVNYTIARLELWRDLGVLTIRENGQWEEITNVTAQ
ncbi:MAG: TolC family protein [Candidatus Omnitrophica bacterium]|nr:TolC family protein [Candidatus Omnitrophota bacterium]